MRPSSICLLSVLTIGCASGVVETDTKSAPASVDTAAPDGSSDGDGGGDGSGDSGDGGDGGDSGEEPAPGPEQFAGEWSGFFELYGQVPGAPEDLPFGCEAELDATIDSLGNLTADGTCPFLRDRDAVVQLEATIDGDGAVVGVLRIDADLETVEATLSGSTVDEDQLEAGLAASVVLGGGPAAGETVELTGSLELMR